MGGDDDRLREYLDKRDFDATPEPRGDATDGAPGPRFVIQEHDASTHHFDLRLEIDGVLASWSVPRGPSTDPDDKRLAVRTEDHPLDYAGFEGTIPEDEYGGGRVIVWDAGVYENLRADEEGDAATMAEALEDGTIEVFLHGEKLKGGYNLVRAKLGGDEDHWLLFKKDDEHADARRNPTSTEPASVLSGRTVDEVGEDDE